MASAEVRKAAVVLTSLPREDAAALLGRLEPKQAEAVLIEIARLDGVSPEEQTTIIQEFADANPHSLGTSSGGLELAKLLGEKALGKNAAGALDNVRHQIESLPFGFLQKVDAQNLLTFIADEHPQTIALVLSHLSPTQAAETLKGLPAERQLAVIRRVATMGRTSPEIINEVEQGLEHRMSSLMNQSFQKAGGVPRVAQILNVCDRATERALMDSMAEDDEELVSEIRRLMFVFDDIGKLGPKEIQTILKNVETSQWAMALKGASEDMKTKILGNMSQRAGEMLKEEMEFLGAVKLSTVEQMQQQIVDVVRTLEDSGQLTLHANEADEVLVQ
ncbi:MAG: flagellar motor switch protein FliG [Pirellulales bacterium]